MKLIFILLALLTIGFAQSPRQPDKDSKAAQNISKDDLRGTDESPFTVKVLPGIKTQGEAAKEQQEKQDQVKANWWLVKLTAILAFIGFGQGIVFCWQGYQLKKTVEKMDEIASGQTADMKASIAEATRASKAMENVAASMESSAASVKDSVAISKEIAETQKLAVELQSRAYLSVSFEVAGFQDADRVFEVGVTLRNHGNTPAYDVTFRATADIIPSPIPEDFQFLLPESTAGRSASFMAPGTTKSITRTVPGRVADDYVEAIKRSHPPRCLAMWGVIQYRDAFKQIRQTKFAFVVHWIPWIEGRGTDRDGNPLPETVMSYDTARHNDAT